MHLLVLAGVTAAYLALGYTIGRIRPYQRLGDWVNWQLRFHTDRWASKPRQAALMVLLIVTDFRNTVHAWRHRKDPEPDPLPPVRVLRVNRPGDQET